MKPAKIYSLLFVPALSQYVLTLEEVESGRLVPIWIGIPEGIAIALTLQGQEVSRPLTHDLMLSIMQGLGGTVEKISVNDLVGNAFHALISIRSGDKILEIDSRPSDAVALAVRCNAPIFLSKELLAKCPTIKKPISESEVTEFKKQLETINPEEFFRKLDG